MIVDSHCHLDCLDLAKYDGLLSKAIDAASDNDVKHLLCVCIDLENFPRVLNIAKAYDNIHATVGLHPNSTDCMEPTVQSLVELADNPKIVAIGETGLDYYRTESALDWQLQRFRRHIQAAYEVNLPLIIHTREAEADTIKIMREENAKRVGGVMHCFCGTWELAEAALELGFYISFSGIVTFKNAKELQAIAKKVPLDRILIETDSPYLAPVPFRGKSNEPAYVRYVAQYLAELLQISYEQVAEQTTENYFKLFNIRA